MVPDIIACQGTITLLSEGQQSEGTGARSLNSPKVDPLLSLRSKTSSLRSPALVPSTPARELGSSW